MKRPLLLAMFALAAVGVTAAAVAAEKPSGDAVKKGAATLKAQKSQYGTILFDGNGRVLYAFTRDRRGGPSRCYGDCAEAWPVYFAKGKPVAGAGVNQSLLGTTKRRDGRLQITYNGWPLYYYAHEGPGEVKCQNIVTHGGTWLVVRPAGKLVR
jgi:predicted lipoprotein with Yx(FWY)xxD motif